MRKISRRLFILLVLTACSPLPAASQRYLNGPLPTFPPIPTPTIPPGITPSPSPTADLAVQVPTALPTNVVVTVVDTACQTPITAPKEPAVIPAPDDVDATTGRHMRGVPQVLDLASYRLAVTGLVDHPLNLSLDDLRCMPKLSETVTTTCLHFADTATWSGVLISDVLAKAGIQSAAQYITLNGADGISQTVDLKMAMDPHNFLAYEMGTQPLPILFGFPVRGIFINVAGAYSVKWLLSVDVS